MVRRLSIDRPTAKVRGVDRRLRALDRWADGFAGYEPYLDERYMNHKIPVLDRLVAPPTTTEEIQGRAIRSLIKAATYLSHSPVKDEVPYFRAAVLLTLPDMFPSEVTAFYSEEYYRGFWHEGTLDPSDVLERYELAIPEGFEIRGALVPNEIDWDQKGMRVDEAGRRWLDEEWWTIGQTP